MWTGAPFIDEIDVTESEEGGGEEVIGNGEPDEEDLLVVRSGNVSGAALEGGTRCRRTSRAATRGTCDRAAAVYGRGCDGTHPSHGGAGADERSVGTGVLRASRRASRMEEGHVGRERTWQVPHSLDTLSHPV